MERFEKSEERFEEAKKYFVGGVNSPARAYDPFPIFMERGEGNKLVDIQGNEFIDYSLAFGPMIFGHVHPKLKEKVVEQIEKGWAFGTPCEDGIEFGRRLVERFGSIDKVRLVNTGTEATMSAIRLARGYTGRDKIVKFSGGFHGAHDSVLIEAGSGASTHGSPDSLGVPEDFAKHTIVVPWNDEEKMKKVFEEKGDEIACIIAEPITGNYGCIPPEPNFLNLLRDLTEANGSLLIFDEVITGFRVSSGGAQEHFGIEPDLTTLGKIGGGGFPIGIFGGREDIMEEVSPSGDVYQAGTFSANPVVVSAGIQALKILEEENVIEKANRKGEELRSKLREGLAGEDVLVQGISSMFSLFLTDQDEVKNKQDVKRCDLEGYNDLHRELAKRGVYFPPSQFETSFLTHLHTEEDLERTVEAVERSLEVLS